MQTLALLGQKQPVLAISAVSEDAHQICDVVFTSGLLRPRRGSAPASRPLNIAGETNVQRNARRSSAVRLSKFQDPRDEKLRSPTWSIIIFALSNLVGRAAALHNTVVMMCGPSRRSRQEVPLIARLFAELPPLANTISSGAAPSSAATCRAERLSLECSRNR